MPFVSVALDVPLDRLFDYTIDSATATDIGRRVLVPFGPRRLIGIIVAISETPSEPDRILKPVEACFTDMPALSAASMELLRFCADYYQYPIGQTLHTALPNRFRDAKPLRVAESLRYIADDPIALAATLRVQAIMQRRLAAMLALPCQEPALRAVSPQAWKTVQGWVRAGLVRAVPVAPALVECGPSPRLNEEQIAAVERIAASEGFQSHLLYGITGSGKTEVYLHSIARTLARGQQALVLVPEINLTPQLEGRFRSRFPQIDLVSLHSGLADGERAAAWVRAARGEARIVLGTRLAVFTPLPALGLVIVDEEHDGSYKQQDGLRYHARDVAVMRAKRADVAIVLGSATPSLESWHNARHKRYQQSRLQARAAMGARPPSWKLISTRNQPLSDGVHALTLAAIGERLARREQTLLFLNRRGYAPVIHCGECGWLAACQRCSARLTVHLRERCLRCHHCGAEATIPTCCPACGNIDIKPLGQGTQRLEETLSARFPHARIARIDRDSMRLKGSFEAALRAIHEGRIDILIGTQMLAKGHDFAKLTLVAVIGADSGLYSADFRAAERLYALLAQVAGRAGRADKPGEVYLQTDFPEHPLYHALLADDYAAFAAGELGERERAGFPPFLHQALLRAEAHEQVDAMGFLQQAIALAPEHTAVTLWDPVAAAMARLADRERVQLLVQSGSRQILQQWLTQWMQRLRGIKAGKVRWSLDVDPLDWS